MKNKAYFALNRYFGYHQRRNESTGEDEYVGAGTLLDTDVVATTATKVCIIF